MSNFLSISNNYLPLINTVLLMFILAVLVGVFSFYRTFIKGRYSSEISQREAEISQREAKIKSLESRLTSSEAEIKNLKNQMGARNEEHAELEALKQRIKTQSGKKILASLLQYVDRAKADELVLTLDVLHGLDYIHPYHAVLEALRQKMPIHRRHEVSEFIDKALEIRRDGYEFQIKYQPEERHYEKVLVKTADEMWADYYTQMNYDTSYAASMLLDEQEKWDGEDIYEERLIIDKGEEMEIVRGEKL